MTKVTRKPVPKQGSPPGKVVLRFGPYAGKTLDEVPIDYLANLRKFDALYSTTRRQVEDYLRSLVRDPGQARMPFGAHDGEQLDELETSYMDWLVGEVDLGPALGWLVKAELRRRESSVPIYDGSEETIAEVAHDSNGNEYLLTRTRPRVVGHVQKLPEVEDWIPFDARGFIPSEALGGGDRKPSVWSQRRPKEQVWAEDEVLGQSWSHSDGQRLIWNVGLVQPPMTTLRGRGDRYSVLHPKPWKEELITKQSYASTGRKAERNVVKLWDIAMEAIDLVMRADDLGDLEDRHAEAVHLVRLLAQEENWDQDSNALLDEVGQAYEARKDSLERREVTFTDAPHRVEPSTRQRARYTGDLQVAKVHEVVRRMRGCRTEDELLDEAAWIRRHSDEFSEEALAHLRKWFCYFKAHLHVQP
jgi:uncharacterized protein (DUF3820 family)